jgi:hypothetical protein
MATLLPVLPTIKGYTVDLRLRQFRLVHGDPQELGPIEFIDFDSPEAEELLDELIAFAQLVLMTLT